MPFKHSPRLPSFDYRGLCRYSVTICVNARRSVFVRPEIVEPVRTQLQITAAEHRLEIIAYCFMPDHLHILPAGTADEADFLRFMRVFKQRSSFHWKRLHGCTLWQRGYIERVLRTDEDTLTVARYILDNPVRAGLVRSPEDYPFSGSMVMDLGELLDSVRRT